MSVFIILFQYFGKENNKENIYKYTYYYKI